jgi:dihydropteroate synthase
MPETPTADPDRSGRALVMGILNVTPDSFSDGGRWLEPDRAVARGIEMIEEGADIVDVGGESTRPGASAVPAEEELRRVLPVVKALSPHVRVSIDTTKEAVAEAAVDAGATLVNDVSASLWAVAARGGVGWVAMHRRGTPTTMQDDPRYDDVVAEVRDLLADRAARAAAAGVREIWIDPGIGFGKTVDHNLELLAGLGALVGTGYPVLVGTSRKGFLGIVGAGPDGVPVPADRRLPGSLATATYALLRGAGMVRVHDVAATVQAALLVGPVPGGPGGAGSMLESEVGA